MIDRQTVKFGDICREVKLSTKDPIADGYERYIGLEHLDSGSLKIKRWGSTTEDNPSFTRVFKKGQVLFGRRRAYLKKAGIAEFDGICSGDIIVMEPQKDSLFKKLLPYIIQSESFWSWAVKNSAGGLSPRTKFKSLAEYSFVEKSKNEVSSLEKSFNLLERVLVESQKSQASIKEISRALVNHLTRYGINREAQKESTVGNIPLSWQAVSFSKVFLVDTKNGLYKGKEHYGTGPKMVHMGDMFHSREVASTEIEQTVCVTEKELSSFGLLNGDLLFARRSLVREGAGLCCIYKGEDLAATFESSIIRARLDPVIANPKFFNYFFRSKYGRWLMERIIQTVAASGITGTDLKKMKVPLPPKEEQDVIVGVLEKIHSVASVAGVNDEKQISIQTALINKIIQ
jgi:type I restriction enzyme S subunit